MKITISSFKYQFRTLIIGLLILFPSISYAGSKEVTKESFENLDLKWPVIFDQGLLGCTARAVWFKPEDQKPYAVNGTAADKGYPKLDPIWAVDDRMLRLLEGAGVDVTWKPRVPVDDLISEGLKLC